MNTFSKIRISALLSLLILRITSAKNHQQQGNTEFKSFLKTNNNFKKSKIALTEFYKNS